MFKKMRHCKSISATPSVASTIIQLKFQYLGDFLVQLENIQRSAAWGIVYGKGGSVGT